MSLKDNNTDLLKTVVCRPILEGDLPHHLQKQLQFYFCFYL